MVDWWDIFICREWYGVELFLCSIFYIALSCLLFLYTGKHSIRYAIIDVSTMLLSVFSIYLLAKKFEKRKICTGRNDLVLFYAISDRCSLLQCRRLAKNSND